MSKNLLITLLIIFLVSSKIFAEDAKSPAELFNKMQKSYKAINSYSYSNEQGEYDTFNKEYQKETAKNYSDYDAKYGDGKSSRVSDKPEYKKGNYEVKVCKPYSIRMKIISSDYTPSVLNNAEFIYRPDSDPKNFIVKMMGLGFIPLEFSRDVQKENTGDFLVMNWTVDLLQLDYFFKNGKAVILQEKNKIDKRDTSILEFKFAKDVKPSVPKYNLGDIPSQVKFKIDYTLGSLERIKYSSVKYWVDKNDLIIIKREEYIGGKLHSTRMFKNITLNNVKKSDI
jgi:outer membrane lipoprotein-sorting protein